MMGLVVAPMHAGARIMDLAVHEPLEFARLLWAILRLLRQPQADLQHMTRQLAALQRNHNGGGTPLDQGAPANPPRGRDN